MGRCLYDCEVVVRVCKAKGLAKQGERNSVGTIRSRRSLGVLLGATIAAASIVGVAGADDISNKLDASIDAAAEIMPLNVGGANGTTQLYVSPTGNDGKNGCNLTRSATLDLSVSSNNTAVATVSPSSVTFTSCGDVKTLTVAPVAAGSATISVSQTANSSSGSFNLAPATFTVNVTAPAPANAAPTVTVAGVTGGASYNKGAVPAATCQVTDAEDGSSSFAATLSAVTGPYASDGIGEQTASCSYTDDGGLTASASETYGIVDATAPTISSTLSPTNPDGDNGWYKSDVTLGWTVTEPESPNSLQTTGCAAQNITTDQAETTFSCSASSAGGTTGPVDVKIKRDATNPTISGSASPDANGFGWNNAPVTVSYSCDDNLSGVASCASDDTLSSEGAGQSATGTAVDNAGNSDTATVGGINIDLTDPGVTWNSAINDGDSYYYGSVPAAPSCTPTDSLSGPNGCTVSGYTTAVGSHTLTATANDEAGNQKVVTRSYTVLAWTLKGFYQPVDMNGVLNAVKNGSTVPLKFELFAGATELTSTADVKSLTATQITCDTSNPTDDIELTATGGTSLRYDTSGGQFIYNWQTPKKPGTCYRVTMTTQDGSTLVALFKLK
jgi:hypothetical protein